MRIETSIDIGAPLEKVWGVTINVEAYPQHTTTLTSVERLDDGPLVIGSQARIKQPAQKAKVWTVTVLESQERFAWTTKSMGTAMTGWHILEPIPTGTRSTLAIELEGALAPMIGLLVRGPIKKAIVTENEGIKAASLGVGR